EPAVLVFLPQAHPAALRVARQHTCRKSGRGCVVGDADADHGFVGREVEGAVHGVKVDAAIHGDLLELFDLAGVARVPGRVGEPECRATRAVREHLGVHEVVRGPELRAVPGARAAVAARAADAVEVETFTFAI